MKRTIPTLLAAVALLGLPAAGAVLEEVVLKVNDAIVTKGEYEKRLQSTLEGLKREYKGPDIETRLKEVPQRLLEQMEEELLLVEKARQLYQVDLIVDNQLEMFMRENKLATKADLSKALEQEGMTLDEFRKQMVFVYIPEFMKSREIRSRIAISSEEVEGFYEAHKNDMAGKSQVHLQEILLPKERYDLEQARAAAADIRAQVASGKDFGELAKSFSAAYSRGAGGDAGWFSREDLSPEIGRVVFPLATGDVSEPVQSVGGFYVFRVVERREAKTPTLDEARPAVVEAIKEQKFSKAYEAYIAELKAQSYVRINPKYV
jgi:peptidyl-prolyl cis-trans isomerase SurA